MKKLCFACAIALLGVSRVNAACTENSAVKEYTSCKPGYYYDSSLLGTSCTRCPALDGTDIRGTTVDKNTGGVTSCYLPAGTTGSDDTGTFKYASDCPYTN